MHNLTIIVIALGVTLAIMLLIVTFTVWKYFRQKLEEELSMDDNLFEKNTTHRSSFEVPFRLKKIQQQLPIDEEKDTTCLTLSSKRRSSAPIRRSSDHELSQSINTNLSNEDFYNTGLARTQRKRSKSLIGHLIKKNNTKDVPFYNLPIPEDELFDGCRDVSANSSIYPEESDTESLNQIKDINEASHTGFQSMKARKRTYKKAGKINFVTFFNREQKEFEVHILRAYNLAPRRNSEEINPYIRVYLIPGKKHKQGTKVQKSIRDPFINEKFIFGDIDDENLSKYRLSLQVCSRTTISKEVLGEVVIALSSIDLDKREHFNMDLLKKRSESSLASIHISMCHEATNSKLNVTILEINNLPKGAGLSGNPDPYVQLTLIRDSGTPNERKYEAKTTIKKSTRNPLFNESLMLDAFTDSDTPLSSYTLIATIKNAAIIKKDETLGHVVFDMEASQKSAINHWKSVEMTPHEPHKMRHFLIDPDEI